MNKNEKNEVVSEVKEMIENSTAIYLTDYAGINVADINQIRNDFRKEGVKYKVFKNTLFKRAIDEAGKFDKLADHLVGMTGYAFTDENPVAPAKIIKKYFDDSKKLAFQEGINRKHFGQPRFPCFRNCRRNQCCYERPCQRYRRDLKERSGIKIFYLSKLN